MKNDTCPSCGQEVAPFEPGAIVEHGSGANSLIGVIVTPDLNATLSTKYATPPAGCERFVAILGYGAGGSYTLPRRQLRQLHGYLHID